MKSYHTPSDTLNETGLEFMPPVSEIGVALPSWEQQLDAVLAWQEAGGNRDLDDGGWPASAGDVLLSMQTVTRVNTLNIALRERLLQLTNDLSSLAIAAMAARRSIHASSVPEPLDEDSARRMQALTRDWFELIAMAEASMSALTGCRRQAAPAARPLVDRRQRAQPIDFADRRKAG